MVSDAGFTRLSFHHLGAAISLSAYCFAARTPLLLKQFEASKTRRAEPDVFHLFAEARAQIIRLCTRDGLVPMPGPIVNFKVFLRLCFVLLPCRNVITVKTCNGDFKVQHGYY